jgi:predicted AAA+ superfamily ATPase
MEYIRTLSKPLKSIAKKFPVIALMGPRQSGKTTLAQSAFPQALYVSLEDPDLREFAHQDPRGFLNRSTKMQIIDEAQRVPELFSYIQTIADTRKKAGQFILTGSSNFLLHESISQSLAGRVGIYRLLPFDTKELKANQLFPSALPDLILKGGYPFIYKRKIKPELWFNNYIQTYLEKDVRQIQQIGNLNLFQRFLKTCALRCGQLINLSNISTDLGVSHHTINQWLSVLEASFIIFRLSPFYENIGKRLVKTQKLYFYDTGLAAYLLGLRKKSDYELHPSKGALFENLVISEYLKATYHKGEVPNVFFWQDKSGNEIDMYVPGINKTRLIECKASSTFQKDFIRHISYYKKLQPNKNFDSEIYYAGNTPMKSDSIHVKSWQDLHELV